MRTSGQRQISYCLSWARAATTTHVTRGSEARNALHVPRSIPTSSVHEQPVTVHSVLGRRVGSVAPLYLKIETQLIDWRGVTACEILQRAREKRLGEKQSADPEVVGLAVVVPRLKTNG